MLALAAMLLTAGWSTDELEHIYRTVHRYAEPGRLDNSLDCIRTTAERIAQGEAVAGVSALRTLLGDGVVRVIRRWFALNAQRPADARFTDAGNEERLIAAYTDRVGFCDGLGLLTYDGCRWSTKNAETHWHDAAKETAHAWGRDAAQETGVAARTMREWGITSLSYYRRKTMVTGASLDPRMTLNGPT